jgi:dienelactone hydrolase
MIERFKQFPASLASNARLARLGPGNVPALLVHPDWSTPAPVVLWLHGRTANKELDPGRYLRWMRVGIAACAIDLPSHGERSDPEGQLPQHSLRNIAQAVGEIDQILDALASPEHVGVFDLHRIAIGGMSMGGMVALRRLCDPHAFVCAAVEGSTGWLEGLYFPENHPEVLGPGAQAHRWTTKHAASDVATVDASAHIENWRPIPLLALHSRADAVVPFATQSHFIDLIRNKYAQAGANPQQIELNAWEQTGAPEEHSGFGRVSNEAKNIQTDFFVRHLRPAPGAGQPQAAQP